MSYAAIAAVLARPAVSAGERLVAFSLASYANRDELAWPGTSVAAARAGMSASAFLEARDRLVGRGLVAMEEQGRGRGKASTLRLLFAQAGPWWESDINVELLEAVLCRSRASGSARVLLAVLAALSDSTRHWHPWAQDRYAAARARGHEHPRALRTLGRAWCRIVWRCWQDHTPYDPAKHRALQQHCTVTVPTSSGHVPDLAATQRMLGAAVTGPAARWAEREALDGKPAPAIPLGG